MQRRQRFVAKIRKTESCWLWTGAKNPDGYGNFRMGDKMQKAHRASWLLFVGEIGELSVLHKCDSPSCVNPKHLFLGTQKDNCLDMVKKKRHVGTRTLTPEQVEEIRNEEQFYGINAALAKKYNTAASNVSNIRNGKRW